MITTVLFDLDNTLIDRNAAFRACVDQHFTCPVARERILHVDEGGHGAREILFVEWKQHGGHPIEQGRLGELIAQRILPDDEFLCALKMIAGRLKLGVITNGGSETQRRKFCAARLNTVIPFNRLWISAEVGMVKPDAGIYLLASQMLEEVPGQCLFIGDHQDDFAGATAAGMRARLVDRVLDAERLLRLIAEEEAK